MSNRTTRECIIKFATEIFIPFRVCIEHVSDCDTFSEMYWKWRIRNRTLLDTVRSGVWNHWTIRPFFCPDFCIRAGMCEKVPFFFMIVKAMREAPSQKQTSSRLQARATPFLVKFLYLCPGGHSQTPFNFQLNPKGSVFCQRLSPIKGFQREPSTTGDFWVKVRWQMRAKKSTLSAKTLYPLSKTPTFSLVSKPFQPLWRPLETKHGRPCLEKNRPLWI